MPALDGLLEVDAAVRMTRLRWLSRGAVEATPAAVKAEVAKLTFLRGMDAHTLDLSVLPAERRRFLASVGCRLTAQALGRREPQRRRPILLTLAAQSAVEVLDEVVALFDQALSARESKAGDRMRDALAERAKSGEDRQALLDAILAIVADPTVPDEEVGGLVCGKPIGWEPLRAAQATAPRRCLAITGSWPRWRPRMAICGRAQLDDELQTALCELEATLAGGDGPVRLDEAGELVISPLSAEYIPAEAVALKSELTDMLPFAPIVSLLIEMDQRTGFLDCFSHAGGEQTRSPELKRNLIAVLIAHASNLGLTRMADACGISYDILAWTDEWYVREETLLLPDVRFAHGGATRGAHPADRFVAMLTSSSSC